MPRPSSAGTSKRMCSMGRNSPDPSRRRSMDDPGELATHLWHELAQRREEGFDVAPFERRWQALGLPPLRVHRPVPDEHRATVEREAADLEALYRDPEA